MAKHYIYTNIKTGKIIFETVQPNFATIHDVDRMVLNETGEDPRLNPLINLAISVVPDGTTSSEKKIKKRLTTG